jgi:hypothetical protein
VAAYIYTRCKRGAGSYAECPGDLLAHNGDKLFLRSDYFLGLSHQGYVASVGLLFRFVSPSLRCFGRITF